LGSVHLEDQARDLRIINLALTEHFVTITNAWNCLRISSNITPAQQQVLLLEFYLSLISRCILLVVTGKMHQTLESMNGLLALRPSLKYTWRLRHIPGDLSHKASCLHVGGTSEMLQVLYISPNY
jgi:hypothetical protein